MIRVALRRPADPLQELSYRISLQELAPQPQPGFMGVQVALRIGLPVFVAPDKAVAAPRLAWSLTLTPDKRVRVGLQNQGNAHVQVSDFSLYLPGSEQPIATEAGSSYLLAGQTKAWLLPVELPQSTRRLHLKAYTDAGNADTEIVLGRP